jgi:hypothetical protein
MKPARYSFLAILALIYAFESQSARSAVLVADSFTLSSGTGVSTIDNTESSGVGTYVVIQGAGVNPMTVLSGDTLAPTFGSGNVLKLENNTNTYYRAFDGSSSFTLNSLALNQKLVMSFNIRFDGASLAAAQNFSFGFVNFSSPNSIIYANADLSAAALGSEFRYRTGSYNMSSAGPTVGTAWTESPTVLPSTSYTIDLAVTKDESGNFIVDYTRNGTLQSSQTFLGNSTWATTQAGNSITGIAFRQSTTPGVTTYLDDVEVTMIPEPSASVLSLAGAISFVFFTRRRKQER